MAQHGVPISALQAWRICKSLDLKPWQVESWMTSHDPDFWAKASDVCGLYLNPPQNAVVWSVDEKSGMQATSRINPTKPAVPGEPVRGSSSTSATAPPSSSPLLTSTTAASPAGSPIPHARRTLSTSWLTWCARPPRDSTCIASPTTSAHTRPEPLLPSWRRTPMCTSTTRPPMPAGSIRLSCSSPSSNGDCSDVASRPRWTNSPIASSPSSRTTTDERHRFGGPTMASPSGARKSQ